MITRLINNTPFLARVAAPLRANSVIAFFLPLPEHSGVIGNAVQTVNATCAAESRGSGTEDFTLCHTQLCTAFTFVVPLQ